MKQRAYTPVEGSTRKALPGARAVGRTNPEQTLNVTIKLRRKKSLPELISRPKKALTREQDSGRRVRRVSRGREEGQHGARPVQTQSHVLESRDANDSLRWNGGRNGEGV